MMLMQENTEVFREVEMKTWLITGGSGGLGKGIADAAFPAGDCVAVTARDKS